MINPDITTMFQNIETKPRATGHFLTGVLISMHVPISGNTSTALSHFQANMI